MVKRTALALGQNCGGKQMAVQKHRKTRSERGKRRSHDALKARQLSQDPVTGETHLRHNVAPDGYYKGREVFRK